MVSVVRSLAVIAFVCLAGLATVMFLPYAPQQPGPTTHPYSTAFVAGHPAVLSIFSPGNRANGHTVQWNSTVPVFVTAFYVRGCEGCYVGPVPWTTFQGTNGSFVLTNVGVQWTFNITSTSNGTFQMSGAW